MRDNSVERKSLVFTEEALVVDVQAFLYRLMLEKGVSRSQLAEAMGVSKGRVSQIFSDECKNLTVRLLARAAYALGEEVSITTESCRELAAKEEREDRSVLIANAPNVAQLWQNDNEVEERELEEAGITACPPGDRRLSAALSRFTRGMAPLKVANA